MMSPLGAEIMLRCLLMIYSNNHHNNSLVRDIDGEQYCLLSQSAGKFTAGAIPASVLVPACRVPRSHEPASSVHRLPFSQVKVLAAMGDSITAALLARSPYLLPSFREFKDVSFSAGYAEDVFSVGSMLRTMSPALITHSKTSQINVARSGDKTEHMLSQAARLITAMKFSPEIDFYNDWKVVTLTIGNNDLCDNCMSYSFEKVTDTMVRNVHVALDLLKRALPRTLVNIVPSVDMMLLGTIRRNFICRAVLKVICPCFAFSLTRLRVIELQNEYHAKLTRLIESERYETKEDFAVVLQPMSTALRLPEKNGFVRGNLMAVDCFHPSYLGQELVAKMFWNNLVTPVGSKSRDGSDVFSEGIKCPNRTVPFIPTRLNSALFG